ncbi:MAG: relaxase domain-containing protein [Opitutus sp.]|nr:relaxase domain-containing protein [Opitutus sp.]MCS6275451.1 relaxase domain-containing protein [Opitutus sp.]MCS6276692.1 relaxase domain-containing protein [Opitutus sp.]MCS6301659.1 relaxase domain-containing protein [Opitutus sp.]
MLTIRTCKDHGHALGQYLRQADYYSEDLKIEGMCYGNLCAKVGLTAGTSISDDAFTALSQNAHAVTGEQLSQRMAAERRAGCDAVFSAPKSVSIQAFIGEDSRLIEAHDAAVLATLTEVERHAARQTGQAINKRHVPTGSIAAAVFRHGESRALDPQLHSHSFIFNVTRDALDGSLVALEAGKLFDRARYFTEIYRNELARKLMAMGYSIEKTEHGFELAGIPAELIARFSKRSQDRDAAIGKREFELGRTLTHDEVAILVRETRQRKLKELSPEEVRSHQLGQVSASELTALRRLRESATAPIVAHVPSLKDCLVHAKEHVFERQAVVEDHTLTAEVFRSGYGHHTLADIKNAITHGQNGLLVVDGRVSTAEAIQHEKSLIAAIHIGIGSELPLGRMPTVTQLSQEQSEAVQRLLDCRDQVMALRGKAGTGKTHSLAAIIEGCASAGRETVCFAPSTKAVEILRRDGAQQKTVGHGAAAQALSTTNTVQRLLIDSALQTTIHGKVLVIDEYGLLSTHDLTRLIALSQNHSCRLLLVGDAAQHTSVEASAAARLVERESRITVAEISEMRRQSKNPAYLRAATALASGNLHGGLARLDAMDAIVEIHDAHERRSRMVDEWFETVHTTGPRHTAPKTGLMVAPTWDEILVLNQTARERLRAAKILKGDDHTVRSLWPKDWTRAQNKDVQNYETGHVLIARKGTKYFEKGDELTVLRREGERVIVRAAHGAEFAVSPKQSGLSWSVLDERPLSVAKGDELRLRAVGQAAMPDGKLRRIANGSTVTVAGVDSSGRIHLTDGATLLSREVVHAYALTSHASQGMTVDAVFMTNPISREGLYVASTRGREKIRIYTPDRKALLDASRLKSEDRISATEFSRTLSSPPTSARARIKTTVHELRSFWTNGIAHGRELALACLHYLHPAQPSSSRSLGLKTDAPTQSSAPKQEAK